jgi:putative ubiquitin-RnfH superfamily antitoxin RatB of RatAB toxin-antitoxin module
MAAAEPPMICVSVAWASTGRVQVVPILVAPGTTIERALAIAREAGLALPRDTSAVAVFGALKPPGFVLREGDRIEITAALEVDPKLARQRRVAHRRASR